MKKTDAWMPIYIGDYLGATQRLTTEQHGAYFLLLMDYWRNGPPPDDDVVLAQIVRLPLPQWRKIKPGIISLFRLEDGKLFHSRAEREIARAADNQDRRSKKAKKAADARWHPAPSGEDAPSNATSNAPSIPEALPEECAPPSPVSVPKGTAAKAAIDPVKELIDAGVALLTRNGVSDAQARSAVGMWRKGYDDAAVLAAIREAARLNAAEPKAYITRCLKNGADRSAALYASIQRTYSTTEEGR